MAEFLPPTTDRVAAGMKKLNIQQATKDLDLSSRWNIGTGTRISPAVNPSEVDIDHSNVSIYSSYRKMAMSVGTDFSDPEDEESYLVANDLFELLRHETGSGQKKIRSLSLAYDSMDNMAFKEVTEILIESINFVENNGILDLSFNSITASSTKQIIQWINKGIRFIYLHGNALCSMTCIGRLCESMKVITGDNLEEVRRLMCHIIFLPKYFVYFASTELMEIYCELHKIGYLPDEWIDIHKEFFSYFIKREYRFKNNF